MKPARFLAFALGVLSVAGNSNAAPMYVQSITNNTGTTANDIKVIWAGGVSNVMVQDPSMTKFPATAQDPGTDTTWAVNQTQGMSVPAGGMPPPPPAGVVHVIWTGNFVIKGGNWTFNGANIGPITPGGGGNVIGNPTRMTAMAGNMIQFDYANPQTDSVTYTNVNIWMDNSAADYNINDFDTAPTGTQVETNGTFVVGPGGDMTQSFAYADPTGYELVECTVTDESTGVSSYMESAVSVTDVPEPTSLAMLLSAMGFLGMRRRRLVCTD